METNKVNLKKPNYTFSKGKGDLGPAPTVAIIGGGLAGLLTAYRLVQNGYKCVVFEGNPSRTGGRCWSKSFPSFDNKYEHGQVFEMGGELIDNGHITMKQLTQELGFVLDNTIASEMNGTERLLYVADKKLVANKVESTIVRVPEEEAIESFKTHWTTGLKKDYNDVSYPWLAYPPPGVFTERSNELDKVSLGTYLDTLPATVQDVKTMDRFNQLVKVLYNIELSGEPWETSCLGLHSLLPTRGPGQFRFWGESNEKYHIRGGNDQLVREMERRVNEAFGFQEIQDGLNTDLSRELLGVKRGFKILKIKRLKNGSYDLNIEVYKGVGVLPEKITKNYARIVSAMPEAVFRKDRAEGRNKTFSWYTDLSESGISALKMRAVQEVGVGPIGKINVSFKERFWNTIGWNGEIVATTRYARYLNSKGVYTNELDQQKINETQLQQCWDVTRGQPGTSGILTNYYIGDYAKLQINGLYATGRVINNKLVEEDEVGGSDISDYERSKWTDLKSNQDNLNRFVGQLFECDETIGSLTYDNLNKDALGNIVSAYESKNWWNDEFARGAFVFYKQNQESYSNGGFVGIEPFAEPIFDANGNETDILDRNFHFAGTWTDYDWYGWMEGAVRSGDRCAMEINSVFISLGYTKSL